MSAAIMSYLIGPFDLITLWLRLIWKLSQIQFQQGNMYIQGSEIMYVRIRDAQNTVSHIASWITRLMTSTWPKLTPKKVRQQRL